MKINISAKNLELLQAIASVKKISVNKVIDEIIKDYLNNRIEIKVK